VGIPRYTRVVLIPDDERSTRQYGVSRPVVFMLILLGLAAAAAVVALMIAFADVRSERARYARMRAELDTAHEQLRVAGEIAIELEEMRRVQEQLLTMLGVEGTAPGSTDSLAAWLDVDPGSAAESLGRAASVSLSPPPDRWPTRGYVTREFEEGAIARGKKPHLGIDIAGPADTPIHAAAPGVVDRVGADDFLGNFVEIRHGLGYLTVYGHCSRVTVARGDRVEAGQVVAYMGKSGQASATHLHFETWRQGEAVDPRSFVAGDPTP
jgi:murein DD-endopeptidase MepM/ murein hydrolase activator NlpD